MKPALTLSRAPLTSASWGCSQGPSSLSASVSSPHARFYKTARDHFNMPSARGDAQGKSCILRAISIYYVYSTTRRGQFEAEDKPSVVGLAYVCAQVTDSISSLGQFWIFYADNCEH